METPLAQGFELAAVAAGFKRSGKPDLVLFLSKTPCVGAGVFTTNVFKAAPVLLGQQLLAQSSEFRGILINTGQANACTGQEGLLNCRKMLQLTAKSLNIDSAGLLPASTGVIGEQVNMQAFAVALPQLLAQLGKSNVKAAAEAMMTTDAFPKYASERVRLPGGEVLLTGFAKGAGMICPNMATMLSCVLCDGKLAQKHWQELFSRTVSDSFNRVTVDGDTSTNDAVYGLANGASGVEVSHADLPMLEAALLRLLKKLAYMLVQDGEGATKVMHIQVTGAADQSDAEKVARTIGHSLLVKTAMYGQDANWGRIVAAIGRSGAVVKPEKVRVSLCGVELFAEGRPCVKDFEVQLKDALAQRDIMITVSLSEGIAAYTLLASDLGHAYVDINADYRS